MQITENIPSHCNNSRNNTSANRCHWRMLEECTWIEQAADLYENLSKMLSGSKRADLQDIKEFI